MARRTNATAPARLDIDLIRSAASARWPEILSSVAGIPSSSLDGAHHPCPKCGGTDRFRLLDPAAGALICNQCFNSKNGDGFAAVQWALSIDFIAAATKIGDYLGIKPNENGTGANNHKDRGDPAEHLSFRPFFELVAGLWCHRKPPITPAGILAAHGQLATYRGDWQVLSLPVFGQGGLDSKPVGFSLYNLTGGTLPIYRRDQPPTYAKIKSTRGSQEGWIGQVELLSSPATTHVWKVEGPSDLLTLLSLGLPAGHIAITNAAGCGTPPRPWMADSLAGKTIYVLHDCDKPGQEGAIGGKNDRGEFRPGWAQFLAPSAAGVRNVRLPFPVVADHGPDLRDWVNQGGTIADLLALAESSSPTTADDAAAAASLATSTRQVNEAVDDPHRLARINLEQYATRRGRTIRYWRDEWYVWKGTNYCKITEKELRAKIVRACKTEFDRANLEAQEKYEARASSRSDKDDEKGPPQAKKVTQGLASNVLQATAGMTVLSSQIEPMTWLPTRERKSYVAFHNGLVDLDAVMADRDDYSLPHSADWFSTVSLPYDFDPKATCPKWEKFLERNLEMDPERIKMLQEWSGYLLLPDTGFQKFMVLEGEGANGKSVYCGAMKAMLGAGNVSHIPLELFGEQYTLIETLDKLCNICGDAGELDKVAEGHLKAFTAGNPMSFGRKYLSAVDRVPTARLMMAVNNRPRFSDRSDGVWRRMLIVPWRIQIPVEEQIANMDQVSWWEASGELPGILIWAIKGLYRLKQQGRFTQSVLCNEALADYRSEMNPARRFLTEAIQDRDGEARIRCKFLYEHYQRWSKENGHHSLAEQQFGKEVSRAFRRSTRMRIGTGKGRAYFYFGVGFQDENLYGHSTIDQEF